MAIECINAYIDIDYTLARDTNQIARYVYERIPELQASISRDQIEHLESLAEFQQLHAVRLYVSDPSNMEHIIKITDEAEASDELICTVPPVPGAADAVNRIKEKLGRIAYITCRREDQLAITSEWLERHGFPNPDRVYHSESYEGKYLRAYDDSRQGEGMLLFDDMFIELLESFAIIQEELPDIADVISRYLVLIAFDRPKKLAKLPVKPAIPVLPLASWSQSDLDALFETLPQPVS